ncbi:pilus assembly protein N-terminal domain-containing protein [Bradyrhizobium sp. NDS-1]|uniref:pilus assembly protein N-terminal domain-containing protein n=1 Tax=Bradyrhizobium sp. NDS-1 TaxID=3080014 RepID=UPI00293F1ED3|nr:pilus assembly protein N-terminal domain-containing protein [Bradyrhizobium sp. NDS-1]WOH70674.1 pilus assembly protein N-terminal domain-containing protein [Bradyrhizobium sp. NDS-1]
MRAVFLSFAVLLSIIAGRAVAEPPKEIVTNNEIKLRAEDARTFAFEEPFGRLSLTVEGVAQIVPETDRAFTLRGLRPGRTLLTAYAPDGRVIHRAVVIIEQTQGYVKIYGTKDQATGALAKDFFGYYCTDTGCGRVDPDKVPTRPSPEQPLGTTVSETRQQQDGHSVTIQRNYPGEGPASLGGPPAAKN